MKDLVPRVAVALVGVPVVLGLLYAGGWVLAVPVALFAALGAGEAYRFAEARGTRPLSWLGMPAAGALVLVTVAHPDYLDAAPWLMGIVALLGVLSLTLALWLRGPGGQPLGAVAATVFGAVYAGLPLACVVLLHALPHAGGWGGVTPTPWLGAMVVALPLACTWIGDASAFFAGHAFGKARLFPSVSPGKSWVGAWAGVLGSTAAAAAWFAVVSDPLPRMPFGGIGRAAALGAALGVAAILGDLVESLLKREAGVKDSGKLLPGHGGVLDRLDALIYTIPLAYLVLRLAGTVS